MSLSTLRKLRHGLKAIDAKLRLGSQCPDCGKPTDGFIPAGYTKQRAGLCICPPGQVDAVDVELPIWETQ